MPVTNTHFLRISPRFEKNTQNAHILVVMDNNNSDTQNRRKRKLPFSKFFAEQKYK